MVMAAPRRYTPVEAGLMIALVLGLPASAAVSAAAAQWWLLPLCLLVALLAGGGIGKLVARERGPVPH